MTDNNQNKNKCSHDPRNTTGAIGMYHCPECGEMVIAGFPHVDYDIEAHDDQLNRNS